MKKLFLLLSLFGLITAGLFPLKTMADPPEASSNGKWVMNLGLGVDLPSSNWQPAYNLGLGGGIAVGYSFNPTVTLGLNLEDHSFSGTNWSGNISNNDLRLLPTIKFYLLKTGLRFYLLAGAGLDLEFLNSQIGSASLTNFDSAVGAGLEIPLGSGVGLFAEGKHNELFFPNGATAGDIPVQAGLVLDLSSPNPNPSPTPQVVYLTVKTVKDETVITGFARGKNEFEFREDDLNNLKEIVDHLLANPGKGLALTGYTDPVGDDAVNAKLSEERAQWLKRYLMKMGLPAKNIWSVKGLGAKDPVGDNQTEEGMALNRRVVIHIMERAEK